MNTKILILIFTILCVYSCKNTQPKVNLFHDFEAFIAKAESQYATVTDKDWSKIETENNDFIAEIESRELSELEKKSLQNLKGRFIGLQTKRLTQKAKKKMDEFLDLGQGVLEELMEK